MGSRDEALRLYRFLLQHLPSHVILLRNMLTSMAYALHVTAREQVRGPAPGE